MEREIKIVLKDAYDPEWQQHPFDVYVDGEAIPRIKRFALDFKYFDIDKKNFDAECFKYTVEQFLDICEEKSYAKGGHVDLTELYDMKDKEHSEIIGMEASSKCLSDALKKYTYTTKDLLNEVSLSWDSNVINELVDKNCSPIKHNISILTKVGFDILYNQDTNEFIIKNMEHVTELNGNSAEETNKIREKAEAIINDTMSMVEAIDVMLGTDD